jgi:hypothetical protein
MSNYPTTPEHLIQNIESGDYFYAFQEMPEDLLNKAVLTAWIKAGGDFTQIPKHYVDDDLRLLAVSQSHAELFTREYPLSVIAKQDTSCYEEFVFLALNQCYTNMEHVDPEVYSEAFFLKALEVNSLSMLAFLTGNLQRTIEWTQPMIDSAASKDSKYLRFFDKSQLKKESLERLITEGLSDSVSLEAAGLLDLMSELMRGGYWPQMMHKPSCAEEALDLLLNNHHTADHLAVYYRAFIRSKPIETVLPLMIKPELQPLILRVYSSKELMSPLRTGLLKGAPRIRGKLLEEGLGL